MMLALYLTVDELHFLIDSAHRCAYSDEEYTLIDKLETTLNGKIFHYSAPIKATFTGVLKARAVALS